MDPADSMDQLRSSEEITPVNHSQVAQPASVGGTATEPASTENAESRTVRYSNTQIRRVRELLARLYAARRAAIYYSRDHPAVAESVAAILDVALTYHREGVDLKLSFFEGEILLGEQLLAEESVLFDQLVRDMTSVGVGSLFIGRGVEPDEMSRAMTVLAANAHDLRQRGGLDAVLNALSLEHVRIGRIDVLERAEPVTGDLAEEAQAAYGGAVSLIREIDRLIRSNRPVPATRVKGAVRSLVDNVIGNRYAMLQLTGLRNYDEYTFYHSANVAILSLALGSMITDDYRFLSSLGTGSLLHDIGKLAVDIDVLNKPGALTPEEWANVKQHPIHGAEMVSLLPGVDKSAVVTILEHHMRYDGSGYPEKASFRRQHLASRIVAVADSYDAMTSKRSYSAARVQDEAMLLLVQSAGTSLDPMLVRLFVKLMGVYPPRTVVRLSAGEIAVVLQPSPTDPARPLVRVIASPSGEIIEPVDIDLSSVRATSITGCVDPRMVNIQIEDYLH